MIIRPDLILVKTAWFRILIRLFNKTGREGKYPVKNEKNIEQGLPILLIQYPG